MPIKKIDHPLLPPDATQEEHDLIKYSIVSLYQKLDNDRDKFLVSFVFELDYSQEMAASCLDVSTATVSKRMKEIRKLLYNEYKKINLVE